MTKLYFHVWASGLASIRLSQKICSKIPYFVTSNHFKHSPKSDILKNLPNDIKWTESETFSRPSKGLDLFYKLRKPFGPASPPFDAKIS